MRYITISKIDFGGGVTDVLPKRIRIRKSEDAIMQYELVIYALLKQIKGVKFKKPSKKYRAIMDYVKNNMSSPEYKVDEHGLWYVECNGEKVYV